MVPTLSGLVPSPVQNMAQLVNRTWWQRFWKNNDGQIVGGSRPRSPLRCTPAGSPVGLRNLVTRVVTLSTTVLSSCRVDGCSKICDVTHCVLRGRFEGPRLDPFRCAHQRDPLFRVWIRQVFQVPQFLDSEPSMGASSLRCLDALLML